MTAPATTPEQIERYLTTLFEPDDVLEIRLVPGDERAWGCPSLVTQWTGRREPVASGYEHQIDVYTAVWLRWAYRRFRELTPTHGQRGAVAALLREARGVTTTARLIRRELRGSLELRSETRA